MPSAKYREPRKLFIVILLTSLMTSVILITIFGFGLYLFFPRSVVENSYRDDKTEQPPESTKRKPSAISPTAISQVKYRKNEITTRPDDDSMKFLGNVVPGKHLERSTEITFSSNGSARKVVTRIEKIDGPKKYRYFKASFREAKFLELAKVLVDNDFLNEPDSKNITSLPIKRELIVSYTNPVLKVINSKKRIKLGHGDKESPELESIMRAFESLRTEVNW